MQRQRHWLCRHSWRHIVEVVRVLVLSQAAQLLVGAVLLLVTAAVAVRVAWVGLLRSPTPTPSLPITIAVCVGRQLVTEDVREHEMPGN